MWKKKKKKSDDACQSSAGKVFPSTRMEALNAQLLVEASQASVTLGVMGLFAELTQKPKLELDVVEKPCF